MTAKPLLHTSSYGYLAEAMVNASNGGLAPVKIERDLDGVLVPVEIERDTFPDGERYHRILDASDIEGEDVVILGGTVDDAETMELYDLSCLAVRLKARSVQLVIPYFGYQTMERAVKPGEDVKAKNRAHMLSYLPKPAGGVSVLALDLHTEGLPEYFENDVQCTHIYAEPLIIEIIERLNIDDNVVLACTDAGRAKWVTALAERLGLPVTIVLKKRIDGSTVKELAVLGDVDGKHVVIFDDMIRTGGSLLQAGKACEKRGASWITAIATHGVLPGDSLKRLEDAVVFGRIIVTDSHPRAHELSEHCSFLAVESIADLLVTAVTGGRA